MAFVVFYASNILFLLLLYRMHKRKSQKKFNGEILFMQTELMSKLATINDNKKETD